MTELAIITSYSEIEAEEPQGFSSRELTPEENGKLTFHLSHARSENTRKAYEYQWRLFVSWCLNEGFLPFPVSVEVICLYLAHLNEEKVKLSKIEQSLSAIRAVHQDQNVLNGADFSHPHIKSVLASIRRSMVEDGRSIVVKPRYFSQAEILKMVKSCPDTPQGVQDRAILLLGANAGLRASEYCDLKMEDLAFDEGNVGVDVSIRSSKTDQFGAGAKLYLGAPAPHLKDFDPVRALSAWMQRRQMYPVADGSLFIAFRKGGRTEHLLNGQIHGLTREAISNAIVRCAKVAGLEELGTETISSHSMRHSFITQAFARHVDATRISKVSRHSNLSVLLEYDRTTRRESSVSPILWG